MHPTTPRPPNHDHAAEQAVVVIPLEARVLPRPSLGQTVCGAGRLEGQRGKHGTGQLTTCGEWEQQLVAGAGQGRAGRSSARPHLPQHAPTNVSVHTEPTQSALHPAPHTPTYPAPPLLCASAGPTHCAANCELQRSYRARKRPLEGRCWRDSRSRTSSHASSAFSHTAEEAMVLAVMRPLHNSGRMGVLSKRACRQTGREVARERAGRGRLNARKKHSWCVSAPG